MIGTLTPDDAKNAAAVVIDVTKVANAIFGKAYDATCSVVKS
jgi:hypothetical protein